MFFMLIKNIPPEVFVGLIGGFLALILFINILLQVAVFFVVLNDKRLEKVWKGMEAERARVGAVMESLERSRQKFSIVEDIKKGTKISWAQKLNIVSDIILPGIWLDRFVLDKDKIEIHGYSVSKKGDYLTNINRFSAALKANTCFVKGMKSVEVASIERKTIEAAGLASFTITATLDKNYEQSFLP